MLHAGYEDVGLQPISGCLGTVLSLDMDFTRFRRTHTLTAMPVISWIRHIRSLPSSCRQGLWQPVETVDMNPPGRVVCRVYGDLVS